VAAADATAAAMAAATTPPNHAFRLMAPY